MKLRILTALSLITLLSAEANAQYRSEADYNSEVGLSAGLAPFTLPKGSTIRGEDVKTIPFYAQATYHYNFTDHVQAGISLGMSTQWETSKSTKLYDLGGVAFPSQSTTVLFADRSFEALARFNYVLPFYNGYKDNFANVYFGIAGGAIFTINDGNRNYKQVSEKQGNQYRYLSEYNYQQATGWVAGIQVGFNYYFAPRWGINVEVAPRYTQLYCIDPSLGSTNSDFRTVYMPTSLGLRFRLR